MGLFNGMFGKNNEPSTSRVRWNHLESIADLEAATTLSNEKIVVIFKHSTRCSISRFVLKQFENTFALPEEQVVLYFLDLIAFRAVSNEIASRFGVVHQSPQLIILKNHKVVYDASHERIDAEVIERYV